MITTRQLAARTGATYRRCDHWARNDHLYCINPMPGHGYERFHPDTEVIIVRRVVRLLAAGFRDLTAAFDVARQLDDGPVAMTGGFVIADTTEVSP